MNCIILLISVSACLVLGDDGETCKFGEVLTLDPVIKMMCIDGSWKPKTGAEAPKGKGKGKGRIAQGPAGSCEDDPSLAANGTCAKDRSHCLQYTIKGEETNLNCAGTCNACDTCRCQDHAQWHPYCPYWAKYCNSPGILGTWMSNNCKKSCHKCSCKCCSYQGKQHSLGAKILLPDKCSFLECREGLADSSSPLIPGAATHNIQHPEELTFEFVTLFDGAECCVLTGDGLGEDGIRYPNSSIIPEGWKGIMEKDNGAWINVTCCHGILCVALNDVASFKYSNTTPNTSSTTPTTTTSTTATTKTTTKTTTTTTSTTTTTTTTTLSTTTTTTYMFVVRLPSTPDGRWSVGPGQVDAIEFTSSKDIHIRGISMFGSQTGSSSYTGLMEMKEGGSVLTSQQFQYTSDGGKGYYDEMFSTQGYARAGVKYTLTVEYSTSPSIWRADGFLASISVVCNGATITFKFTDSSDSTNGSNVAWGQIPRIIFAC